MHPQTLGEPYRWRNPRVVFVNSMVDLFHAKVSASFVRDVFDIMRETPQHTYQLLTKRTRRLRRIADQVDWPENVWMGVSVESMSSVALTTSVQFLPPSVSYRASLFSDRSTA